MKIRSSFCILTVILMLLSSCQVQDDNTSMFSNTSESIMSLEDIIETKITDEFSYTTSLSELIFIEEPFENDIIKQDRNEPILLIFPFEDNKMFYYEISGIPFYAKLLITPEFEKLVNKNELKKWKNDYIIIDSKNPERNIALRTDLSDSKTLYDFICDFNLSEKQVRNALVEWNESDDISGYIFEKHIYSEEEITALALKNKTEVTRLFANPQTLIKGDKYYAPGWFFYASNEEYRENNITKDDIMFIIAFLNNYKIPCYFKDLIEKKFMIISMVILIL